MRQRRTQQICTSAKLEVKILIQFFLGAVLGVAVVHFNLKLVRLLRRVV